MLFVFLQLDLLGKLIENIVYPDTNIAALSGVFKDLLILAFFTPDHRGEDLDTGTLGECDDLINDLINGLLTDLFAADRTVGSAHPCPEKTKIVIDLGDSSDGGAGVFTGGFLVDGDSGGETINVVHIRFLHLSQKHSCVGGQAFHIPALTFCVNGIKRKGGFS